MDGFISFRLLDHDGPVGIVHRAVLLLPVAFKAGGLILRFATIPSETSIGLERSTSPLFGPTALSLQKLEIRARDAVCDKY